MAATRSSAGLTLAVALGLSVHPAMGEELEGLSGGSLAMKLYPAGQLGAGPDPLRKDSGSVPWL